MSKNHRLGKFERRAGFQVHRERDHGEGLLYDAVEALGLTTFERSGFGRDAFRFWESSAITSKRASLRPARRPGPHGQPPTKQSMPSRLGRIEVELNIPKVFCLFRPYQTQRRFGPTCQEDHRAVWAFVFQPNSIIRELLCLSVSYLYLDKCKRNIVLALGEKSYVGSFGDL
jgi:hypothetical protein